MLWRTNETSNIKNSLAQNLIKESFVFPLLGMSEHIKDQFHGANNKKSKFTCFYLPLKLIYNLKY